MLETYSLWRSGERHTHSLHLLSKTACRHDPKCEPRTAVIYTLFTLHKPELQLPFHICFSLHLHCQEDEQSHFLITMLPFSEESILSPLPDEQLRLLGAVNFNDKTEHELCLTNTMEAPRDCNENTTATIPSPAAPNRPKSSARQIAPPRPTDHTYTDFALQHVHGHDLLLSCKSKENFPAKFHRMISDPANSRAIQWMPHGRGELMFFYF